MRRKIYQITEAILRTVIDQLMSAWLWVNRRRTKLDRHQV